jgi:uncharacterized protein (TIGR02186 family)
MAAWLKMIGVLACFFLTICATTARSQGVEVGASENYVYIKPDFDGSRVVLFGAIDRTRFPGVLNGRYDVAIVINGPKRPQRIYRKEQVGGLWLNRKSVTFEDVPSLYWIISNKVLTAIAPLAERQKYGIGLDTLKLAVSVETTLAKPEAEVEEFHNALIRRKQAAGLYGEDASGVEMLGNTLFKGTADLPASITPGLYKATVYLFEKGRMVQNSSDRIRVQKVGIERYLSALSVTHPTVYGFAAVFVALAVGAVAALLLRR